MGKRILTMLLVVLGAFFVVLNAPNKVGGATDYVGSETCKDCHEGYYTNYSKSIHAKRAIPGSPANRDGCESCHGPGAQHVEKSGGRGVAIFAFDRRTDANTKSSKCLACHEELRTLAHWSMSRHKSGNVSCDNCHSIHTGGGKLSLKARDPDLCFSCHKNIRAQINKQSHHPINVLAYPDPTSRISKVKCSDCHNPHGTFSLKGMINADSVNELCYKCHAEKRGPYAWEHPPVAENCLNCHEIHGSNHTKLLTRKVPLLCQSCHNEGTHPIRPYTDLHSFGGPATSGKNRFIARSCLNCHSNIHGSNSPALGVRFIR
jgi:DmsE family decaheme c-type cytochrome